MKQLGDLGISFDKLTDQKEAAENNLESLKKIYDSLISNKDLLHTEKEKLLDELISLKKEFESVKTETDQLRSKNQEFQRLFKGKGKLDEVLALGKQHRDYTGIGYSGSQTDSQRKFISSGFLQQSQKGKLNSKIEYRDCAYCNLPGHCADTCLKIVRLCVVKWLSGLPINCGKRFS